MIREVRAKAKRQMKKAKAKVWTGRKRAVLRGTLEPLVIDGYQPRHKEMPVQLFHAGRVWWLYYEYDHQTGGFKSKKDAVRWWTIGGR